MKNKPVITTKIETVHTSFAVNFDLDYNIIFIIGDSGTGKSAVFSFIEEMAAEDSQIKCFNYFDKSKNYKGSIKNSKNKLFVIDNADILLDDSIRQYIAIDMNNQYVIIGRNPTGLMLVQDNFYEIKSVVEGERTIFSLVKAF